MIYYVIKDVEHNSYWSVCDYGGGFVDELKCALWFRTKKDAKNYWKDNMPSYCKIATIEINEKIR